MIRTAEYRDCHRITAFLEQAHKDLELTPRFVRGKVRKTLQVAVSNPKMHRVWYVELDGQVEGVLIGATNQIWYSHHMEALDLAFVVSSRATGYGGLLARRFVRWARNEARGVRQIVMSESVAPNERLERMYQRMGFTHTGGVYRQEVEHERCD